MAKLDIKALFAERKLRAVLVIAVVTYFLVFQVLYNTFWKPSTSTKRFLFADGAPWLNFWKSDSQPMNENELVHIHGENQTLRHGQGQIGGHVDPGKSGRTSVAIGGGITSKRLDKSAIHHMYEKFQFFKVFLPSFCQTASAGYEYHFYLAYDSTDALFSDNEFLTAFQKTFVDMIAALCSDLGTVSLHLVECSHAGKPAWAQNDAMLEAYLDNVDYHYRINDDTVMKTKDWTRTFIETLNALDPPRVGVVGPNHSGGNTAILTYDFVHRTHVDIFGFYYPRLFTDWFADGWITRTYRPDRCKKLPDVLLVHTLGLGQRYHVKGNIGNLQAPRVLADKVILDR